MVMVTVETRNDSKTGVYWGMDEWYLYLIDARGECVRIPRVIIEKVTYKE